MRASKSQLQGLRDLQQVGGKRAAPGARGGSGSLRNNPPGQTCSELQGGKSQKIVHPKATTGIMSSEAVEEKGVGVGGEKWVCLQKFLFKI